MKRSIFSQSVLGGMVEAGKITIVRGVLTMLSEDNPAFPMRQAFRIIRTIDNYADPNGLVGQIRSDAKLRELGAETHRDAVIHTDIAYQAGTDFLVEKRGHAQAAAVDEPPADAAKDANDLSKLIRDNLL
jgi:hypothetical protein